MIRISDNAKGILLCIVVTVLFMLYNVYYEQLSHISVADPGVRAFAIVAVFAIGYDGLMAVIKKEYRTRWLIAGVHALMILLVVRLFWFTYDFSGRSAISACVSLVILLSALLKSRKFLYDDSDD